MLDYDFAKLNDKEFEAFCVDLLSEHFVQRFERFKPGKDAGIDGRFFNSTGLEVILQCKHWAASGVDALVRHLKSVENLKLDKLRPRRYLFATSLPLSRKNKSDIQAAVSPWIRSPSDIFGQEDLNSILGHHRAVEQRHYKLWFASVSIMLRLQNASIKGRSEFKLQEARAFAPKYVVTTSHREAIEKLERLRNVIITGEPGIGKSTLAEQIALQYAIKGFELCSIADTVEEAEAVWERDSPQLFYFDDFLGRNYLLALNRHEDSHIVGLIKRVRQDPNKRFILTSRTTVLNQGKSLTDLFRIENLDRNEYELTVDRLSLLDKARILYNHIWESGLGRDYVDQLYVDQRYMAVSRHRNYNPRLISFITDSQKIEGIAANSYWSYVEETLANPKDIWAHVFERQLNRSARILVRLTVFHGRDIPEQILRAAFLRHLAGGSSTSEAADEFNVAIRLTVGSVLNRNLGHSDSVTLSLFNPSLGDFAIRQYKNDSAEIFSYLAALQTESSLTNLRSLIRGKIIDEKVLLEVASRLATALLRNSDVLLDYRITLADLCREHGLSEERGLPSLNAFVVFLLACSESIHPGAQANLLWLGLSSGVLKADDCHFIAKVSDLVTEAADEDEFQSISLLISSLSAELRQVLEPAFVSAYVEYWRDNIRTALFENGMLDKFVSFDDADEAKEKVRSYVEDRVGELYVTIDAMEVDDIIDASDIIDIISDNQQRSLGDYEFRNDMPDASPVRDEVAAIHDLFDRDDER